MFYKSADSYLDIGCATGECVLFSEELGYSAVGIDNNRYLLSIAGEKKIKRKSSAEFIFADMRDISMAVKGESFDIITCLGNTLVHLDSADEISTFFKSVFSVLKKGGIFLSQIVNYEKFADKISFTFSNIETNEFNFERKNIFKREGEIVEFTGKLFVKKEQKWYENKIMLYPINKDDIEAGLSKSGFHKLEFYGGFDRREYSIGSDALLFRAEK